MPRPAFWQNSSQKQRAPFSRPLLFRPYAFRNLASSGRKKKSCRFSSCRSGMEFNLCLQKPAGSLTGAHKKRGSIPLSLEGLSQNHRHQRTDESPLSKKPAPSLVSPQYDGISGLIFYKVSGKMHHREAYPRPTEGIRYTATRFAGSVFIYARPDFCCHPAPE